jgi:competence protein ComEC
VAISVLSRALAVGHPSVEAGCGPCWGGFEDVDVTADVLKVPHHGSADQEPRFIQQVGARVATVSAGKDNDYGHPTASLLAMLRTRGTKWWRTDVDGDIAVVLRDGRLHVVSRG